MTSHEQITHLIYDAIARVNETLDPKEALAQSPDTVLMGDSCTLDSMGFVTFLTAFEENLAKATKKEISVVDAMFASEVDRWTVLSLAHRLAEVIDGEDPVRLKPDATTEVVGPPARAAGQQ